MSSPRFRVFQKFGLLLFLWGSLLFRKCPHSPGLCLSGSLDLWTRVAPKIFLSLGSVLLPHPVLLRENAIGVPRPHLVQSRIYVSRTSVPSIFHGVRLFVGVVVPGSSIVYVLRFLPCLKVLVCFSPYNIFHREGI